jgi:sortase A
VTAGGLLARRDLWRRRLVGFERLAWALAVVLGGTWLTARVLAWSAERRSVAAFHELAHARPEVVSATLATSPRAVDQRLWAPARIAAHARALVRPAPPPLALLRIPRLGLDVPVLEGTDEWTLDRAVGHIEGTTGPAGVGNVGLAGHRDGYFRVLKDVVQGDVIELALPAEVRRFRVARLSIVSPEETSVLAPTRGAELTLVTCYPFYFVGSAPQRFIVQATPE